MTRNYPAMRSCPQCGRTYGDEYNFCLVDGTFLSDVSDPNKTEVIKRTDRPAPDSVPTVESHKRGELPPTVKVESQPTPEPPLPTIAAFTPRPFADQPYEKKRSVARIVLTIALSVIAIIVVLSLIGGIVVGIVESSRDHRTVAANATSSPTATPTPKPALSPTLTATPSPDPTRTKPIVIPNPTLEATPTQMANMEGLYYLREFNSDDTVFMTFEVYDQNGGDFYVYAEAKDLYGTVHLAPDESNHYVGYVVWKYPSGNEDREIFYLCEKGRGFCGKLPAQSWYFVATKRSGD